MDRKNRVMLAAAIGAVVVLVASSAVRCAVSRSADTAPEQPASEQSQEADMGARDKAMEALRGHAWRSETDASASVEFREGSFVETRGGQATVTAFEVTGSSEGDDWASLDVSFVRDGASGEAVVMLEGREGSLRVASDAFANADAYVEGKASAGPVAVSGVTEPYTSLIDGRTDELAGAVADHCRRKVPAATRADFDGEVFVDVKGGRVSATFTCDDPARTILNVTYDGAAFKVEG